MEPCEYLFSDAAGLLFKEILYDEPHTLIKEETREISNYQICFLIPIKWEFISVAISQFLTINPIYKVPIEIQKFLFTFKEEHEMVDAIFRLYSAILQNSEGSKFFNRTCEDNSFLFRWNLRRSSPIEKKLSCFSLEFIADFSTPNLFRLICERLR